jgi:hypothetical protein
LFCRSAAPRGKITDASHREPIILGSNTSTDYPQQSVVVHRHHQTICEKLLRLCADDPGSDYPHDHRLFDLSPAHPLVAEKTGIEAYGVIAAAFLMIAVIPFVLLSRQTNFNPQRLVKAIAASNMDGAILWVLSYFLGRLPIGIFRCHHNAYRFISSTLTVPATDWKR